VVGQKRREAQIKKGGRDETASSEKRNLRLDRSRGETVCDFSALKHQLRPRTCLEIYKSFEQDANRVRGSAKDQLARYALNRRKQG